MRYSGAIVNRVLAVAATVFFAATATLRAGAAQNAQDAIRAQLPVILSYRFHPENVAVDPIVTEGANAFAVYKSGDVTGYAVLRLRDGKWWLRTNSEAPSGAKGAWEVHNRDASCSISWVRRPSAQELIDCDGFSSPFAESAIALLDLPPTPGPGEREALYKPGTSTYDRLDSVGPYPITFSATSADPSGIAVTTVPAGFMTRTYTATVSVWAPYVLDTDAQYVLTVSAPSRKSQRIRGTLEDNTLNFTWPPNPAPAGTIFTLRVSEQVSAGRATTE